jgi:hypothetical protein
MTEEVYSGMRLELTFGSSGVELPLDSLNDSFKAALGPAKAHSCRGAGYVR